MNIIDISGSFSSSTNFSNKIDSAWHKTQTACGRFWKSIDTHLIGFLLEKKDQLINHGYETLDIIIGASNSLEGCISGLNWLAARVQSRAKYLANKDLLPNLASWSKKFAHRFSRILNSSAMQKALSCASIFSGILIIPSACKSLHDSFRSFIKAISSGSIDKQAVLNYLLDILDSITYLAWSPAGILEGLVSLGKLSDKVLCWIPILNVVFAAVSGALVMRSAYNLLRLIDLKRDFKKVILAQSTDQAFETIKNKIKDLSDFQTDKIFLQDKESLQEWIGKIEHQANPEEAKKKALEIANKCLKTAIWAEALNGCSSVLWFASGITLIIPATTSFSPFITAAAAIGSISASAFSWYSTHYLEKDMAALAAG